MYEVLYFFYVTLLLTYLHTLNVACITQEKK